MGSISMLLVDDNATFLRILARFLQEQSQADIVVVGSVVRGRDAVAQALVRQPQVILLDLDMPDLSGLEMLPQLRERMPEVIIIALTLLDPASYRQAALAAGADEYVSKASLEADLLPAIRRLASARRYPGGLPSQPEEHPDQICEYGSQG